MRAQTASCWPMALFLLCSLLLLLLPLESRADTSDEGKSKDELRKELHELRSRMQELLAVGDGSNEFLDKRAMLPYSGGIYGKRAAMLPYSGGIYGKRASLLNAVEPSSYLLSRPSRAVPFNNGGIYG